jgi:hypothetical protein
VAKPKTIGSIFKTIFNEFKGIGRSLVSARTPSAKAGVVANFFKRTVGNIIEASAIGIRNIVNPKKPVSSKRAQATRTKKTNKTEIGWREEVEQQIKERASQRKTDRQTTNTQVNDKVSTGTPPVKPANTVIPVPKFPSKSAHAKVYYMTDSMRTAIANTQRLHKIAIEKLQRDSQPKNPPKPFQEPKNGETYNTKKCRHICCEGTGEFVVTDKQDQWYKSNLGNYAESCYPCRLWAYNTNQIRYVSGYCEKCENLVKVESEEWIGYHKFIGKPIFSNWCEVNHTDRNQIQKIGERRILPYSYTGRVSSLRNKLKDNEVWGKVKKTQNPNKALVVLSNQICIPITNLIDISGLTTDRQLPHFYHTKAISGSNGTHSAYRHIELHIFGGYSTFDGRPKDATLTEFTSAYEVICEAHRIAALNDPSRFVDRQLSGKQIRTDIQTGIEWIFAIGETNHLITAYRSASSNHNELPDPVKQIKRLGK